MKTTTFILIFLITVLLSQSIIAQDLNVTTFNIGALSPFSASTNRRVKLICKTIKKSNYDIVFIQEAWQRKYRKKLKKCGYPYILDMQEQIGLVTRWKRGLLQERKLKRLAFIFNLFKNNYGYDTGLMILSKFPFYNQSKLRFFNGVNENFKWDGEVLVTKGVIGATILHPTLGEIFIANTHLVAEYSDHNYFNDRLSQGKMIRYWIQKKSKGNPIIIGGDFNVSPPRLLGEHRHNRTDLIWEEFRNKIFKQFDEAPLNYLKLTTYPNKSPKKESGVLDHIFVSKELDIYKGKIIFKEQYRRRKKYFRLSDHYGMNATIR